jgi:HEPN domain-containing protein
MSAHNEYLEEWVRKAEEDYEVALTLVRKRKSPTPNAVCFHCQQCAEKYLKALLVQGGVVFSKTHDLRELRRLALEVQPSIDLVTDLLLQLNPYAVELRYPGEEATMQEARDAVVAAKEVRRFVRSRLGLPE